MEIVQTSELVFTICGSLDIQVPFLYKELFMCHVKAVELGHQKMLSVGSFSDIPQIFNIIWSMVCLLGC